MAIIYAMTDTYASEAYPHYTGPWIVNNEATTALPAGVSEVRSEPAVRPEEQGWIGI